MNLNRVVLLQLFVVAIFSLITMNSSHSWGDDFAMYLMHAENIATGKPYAETGFIYNDLAPTYAPQSYPPGFPLLLAPVQPYFGLNYGAYKVYLLFFFIIYLWCAYVYLRNKIADIYVVAILFILGMCPFIWQLRDSILADIPGALFFILSCMLFEIALKQGKWKYWISCGILIYLSYSTRSTSIVLIPAFFMHLLFHNKRYLINMGVATLIFIGINILMSFLFHEESNYFSMLSGTLLEDSVSESLHRMGVFTSWYFNSFKDLYIGNYHNIFVNSVAFYATFALFLIGLFSQLIKKHTYLEWIMMFIIALVIVWPGYQGLRYFTPVLIIYLYYAVKGIELIPNFKFKNYITGALMILIISSFISFYTTVSYGAENYAIDSKGSEELFDYIKQNTENDAIIMSSKPRAVCLITERRGIVYPDINKSQLLNYCIEQNNVGYLVLNNFPAYPDYGETIIKPDSIRYTKVFENTDWIVLKVK